MTEITEDRIREIIKEELVNFSPQKKKRGPNKWQMFLSDCSKRQPSEFSYTDKVKACSIEYKAAKKNGGIRLENSYPSNSNTNSYLSNSNTSNSYPSNSNTNSYLSNSNTSNSYTNSNTNSNLSNSNTSDSYTNSNTSNSNKSDSHSSNSNSSIGDQQ